MKTHKISFVGQASGNNSMCGLWETKHGKFDATYIDTYVTCKHCLKAIERQQLMEKNENKASA